MMTALMIFGITLGLFLLVIAGMAVGVIFGRREISGSCGGLGNQAGADGEGESAASCSLCSNPAAACKELRDRMEAGAGGTDGHPSGAEPEAECGVH